MAKTFLTSPQDLEAAHPELNRDLAVPTDQVERLVARYSYRELDRVNCQLREKDSACNQRHGLGSLALTKSGQKGYIGNKCARGHFNADASFKAIFLEGTRDLNLQRDIDSLTARLTEKKSDTSLKQKLELISSRAKTVETRILSAIRRIPGPIFIRLTRMAGGSDRAIRGEVSEVKIDRDENGKERRVTETEPVTVAIVARPDVLHTGRLSAIRKRASEATAALNVVLTDLPYTAQTKKALAKIAKSLDGADEGAGELDAIEAAFVSFMKLENLASLCWLAPRLQDQLSMVEYYLQLSGKPAKQTDARTQLQAWRDEIERKHKGLTFRAL